MNVDDIAPLTPELVRQAERRTREMVLRYWRRCGATDIDGLASSCYAQGVRDMAAVAAATILKEADDE